MKKALLSIALLFGLASVLPTHAQRVATVATSEGSAAATLEELATLAENGTPVMLWNNGRSRYIENSPNADGELMLALYTAFQAGNVSTNSQLWKLEKAEGENSYRRLVIKDGLLKGFIIVGDVSRAGIYTALIRERTPLAQVDLELLLEKPQLMLYGRAVREDSGGNGVCPNGAHRSGNTG